MGNDVSKLAPSEDERAGIEAAAAKKADDDMDRYAAQYRKENPQLQRRQRDITQLSSAGQASASNEDLEPGGVVTDAESDSITLPIRTGNSSQVSPQATDLLASSNPRKQKETKNQHVQDDKFIGFGNARQTESSTRKPVKEDTKAGSGKFASKVTSTTSSKSPGLGRSPSASSTASKRPAPEDKAVSGQQISAVTPSNMPKIQKRSSVASPQSPDRVDGGHTSIDANQRPPVWYMNLKVPPTRTGNDGGIDTLLGSLRAEIRRSRSLKKPQGIQELEDVFDGVRNKLHTIVFKEVKGVVLRRNRMLHDADGLPSIFDQRYSNGVQWPFDIKADAMELYNKWCRKDFGTDIMRGIIFVIKGAKKDGGDRIDPSYTGVVNAKRHGNNGLVNGQWWPFQICALRDGAHGSIQGGISGSKDSGAFSCILSGGVDSKGQPYPDKDEGNIVWYCGTDSTDGELTAYTQRMLESVNNESVRLIRSHNAHSTYAPEYGFRYDGLYDVTEVEIMDPKSSIRQRHRFKLVRVAGQDPIRGGKGPEKRPTKQEIDEYLEHQKLSGKGSKGYS